MTASKRAQSLQHLPQAVSVVESGQLLDQNITNVADLPLAVPSLAALGGPDANLAIRGIGTQSLSASSESSVGVVVDGVDQANTLTPFAPMPLFDVARVEVLEGPQGTLFGRNASAGVLNIVTNAPKLGELEAATHLEVGTRDSQIVQSVLNVPLGETAALRIAGHLTRFPEFTYGAYDHRWNQDDDEGGRVRLLWRPTSPLSVNLEADVSSTHLRNDVWVVTNGTAGSPLTNGLAVCGVTASKSNDASCINDGAYFRSQSFGLSGQIDYSWDGFTLSAITAGRWLNRPRSNQDSDNIPVDVVDINGASQRVNNVSEELRLTSPTVGRFEYLIGLYYFHSTAVKDGAEAGTLGIPRFEAGNLLLGQQYTTSATEESYAAFGQATYRVTPKARLILGGRLDHEDVWALTTHSLYPGALAAISTLATLGGHVTDTDFSYRVGGQYDLTRTVMAYVTYTRGYKGPAINDGSASTAVPLIVQPEIPHDVELGVKADLLDRRLALNLNLFHNEVDNFQAQVWDPAAVGFYFGNAPSLTSQGVELSIFGRPLDGLSLNGGLSYVDATYGAGYLTACGPLQTLAGCVTTNVGGRRLVGSPLWKVTLNGEYRRPISRGFDATLQLDGVYTSPISYSAAPDPLDATGAHIVLGGRIGVRTRDDRFGVSLYVRNLTDERVPTRVIAIALAVPSASTPGLNDPSAHGAFLGPDSFRTIGLALDTKF